MPAKPLLAGIALLVLLTSASWMNSAFRDVAATPAAASNLPAKGVTLNPSFRPWRDSTRVNPDSWWDPANGLTAMHHDLSLVRQLGAAYLRIEFPWWALEKERKGQFDWSRADQIVEAANAADVLLAPAIVFTPAWASPGCSNPSTSCTSSAEAQTCPAQPPSASDFGDFVKTIVSRYGADSEIGRVRYWELWNEPNLSKYFSGSAAQYAQDILIPGYDAAKSADPSVKVLFGGQLYGGDSSWTQAVLQAGGSGHFDILAFHAYGDSGLVLGGATAMAGLSGGKPVWVGEFGAQSPDAQPGLVRDVLGVGSALSVGLWYELRDDQIWSTGSTACFQQTYGLVDHSYTTKPAFATFQAIGNVENQGDDSRDNRDSGDSGDSGESGDSGHSGQQVSER